MLKRAGRGHDPSGVLGTKPGELAVVCRACPIPGINLPDGWEDAPPEIQYVHLCYLLHGQYILMGRMQVSILVTPMRRCLLPDEKQNKI